LITLKIILYSAPRTIKTLVFVNKAISIPRLSNFIERINL